jgi:hypothetical protein
VDRLPDRSDTQTPVTRARVERAIPAKWARHPTGPCPLYGSEDGAHECRQCDEYYRWTEQKWDRMGFAATALVARMLELWPSMVDDRDLLIRQAEEELRVAFRVLLEDPEGKWPLTEPRRRPINGAVRIQVFERDAYRCVRCGSWEDLTVDHCVALIAGGADHIDNYQTLCGTCNGSKGAKA